VAERLYNVQLTYIEIAKIAASQLHDKRLTKRFEELEAIAWQLEPVE
jgi:hypothetical protein